MATLRPALPARVPALPAFAPLARPQSSAMPAAAITDEPDGRGLMRAQPRPRAHHGRRAAARQAPASVGRTGRAPNGRHAHARERPAPGQAMVRARSPARPSRTVAPSRATGPHEGGGGLTVAERGDGRAFSRKHDLWADLWAADRPQLK
jgi:hypothetical protein